MHLLAVLRASAVMPPRAGCCYVLRSTLRVAQLATIATAIVTAIVTTIVTTMTIVTAIVDT